MAEKDFQKYLTQLLLNPKLLQPDRVCMPNSEYNLTDEERLRINDLLRSKESLQKFSQLLNKKRIEKFKYCFKESFKYLMPEWDAVWMAYLDICEKLPDHTFVSTIRFIEFLETALRECDSRFAKAVCGLARYDADVFFMDSGSRPEFNPASAFNLAANCGIYSYECNIPHMLTVTDFRIDDEALHKPSWLIIVKTLNGEIASYRLSYVQYIVLSKITNNSSSEDIYEILKNHVLGPEAVKEVIKKFKDLKLIYNA